MALEKDLAKEDMAVDVPPQFDEALLSGEPTLALRSTVKALLEQGWERENLLRKLENYRLRLRTAGRTGDEDVVLEVMDFVTGWASPHMTL